jgi:hypothetical protein
MRHLSEDFGFRIVGIPQRAVVDEWMINAAQEVQRDC